MANWVVQGGGRTRVLGYYPSTSLEECFPPFFSMNVSLKYFLYPEESPPVKMKTK